MKDGLLPFYPIILLMPLLMSFLAYGKSRSYKKNEFFHLSEFYLSMAAVTISSWFFLPMGSAYIILSMLPWIWTLRTLGKISEDISRQTLFTKLHLYVLVLGGIVSIVFLSFEFTLSMVAAPFSLSIGFIGLTFFFQTYSKHHFKSYGYLQHINIILILAFFVSRLVFPILITNPERIQIALVIDFYLLILYSTCLYPLYSEIVFEDHERLLENVLHTRNKQLLSHSGFSEYKILAAGLSHEVNNALTIINAKISHMIRGKSKDPEKDLQIVQSATNRIVSSIRNLREFIYPHEVQEILDLNELVNEVMALYGQRLINHGVQMNVTSLSGKLIRGQRVQMNQVFLSLINNSMDAIDELDDKWIKISAKKNEDKVEILYQDSSPSKADKITPLLTDPFYSYYEFMDNDIRLILGKEIIERHGGTLNCAPQSDLSTFIITLPLVEAAKSTSGNLQNKINELKELH